MGFKVAFIFLGTILICCNHIEAKDFEHVIMKSPSRNAQFCLLCQEFITKAIFSFSENETRTKIIDSLHQECLHLHSFKPQCVSLVDYYLPLLFLEVAKLQPKQFCKKINLCNEMTMIDLLKHDDPCTLCRNAVDELLTKLEDPDAQFELIQALLKICNHVDNYALQCKKFVLQYGPIILAKAEQFFAKTDICTAVHVCKAPKITDIEPFFSAASWTEFA